MVTTKQNIFYAMNDFLCFGGREIEGTGNDDEQRGRPHNDQQYYIYRMLK
jgi:hypothetical protein